MSMESNDSLSFEKPAEVPPEKQPASSQQHRRHVRRIVGMGIVSLACLGLLAVLGSQLLTPTSNQAATVNTLIGHAAPDFTLSLLSTSTNTGPTSPATMHLAALRGQPIILNFWASWCDPCKQEAPLLEANWQKIQSQGVLLIGINMQDTQSEAQHFLRMYGITYPNVIDSTTSTMFHYDLSGLPDTFFLNSQGVILAKVTGELTEQMWQSNLLLITRT